MRKILFVAALVGASCGGDDDGAMAIDAAPAMVATVDCATVTPAVTVTTSGSAYSPAVSTITVGQVVRFTMPGEHNAKSRDDLWLADFGQDTCVRFDSVGTFSFFCVPHGFTGRIMVTD